MRLDYSRSHQFRRFAPSFHGREGSVLIYFVMIVFALLGLAALVIDLGLARLTQREMQAAADSAAVEGLRGRDAYVFDSTQTAQQADAQRRQAASDRVVFIFDDDFHPLNGDPYNFGAGPVLNFSGGIPIADGFEAAQTFSIPNPPVYKPALQPNLANNQAGDMVSGTYQNPGVPVTEGSDYSRIDFDPKAAAAQNAFLVRLRRSNESFDSGSGESSGGPPLAYLFGRGSFLAPQSKARGITVRATAIADARQVLSVGPAYPAALYNTTTPSFAGIPGATPFALNTSFWQAPSAGPFQVDSAGVITDAQKKPVGQMIRVTGLAADLSAGAATVTVTSSQGFPVAAPFRIRIGSELLLVTGGAGTTSWTVQRGIEGTQPGSPPANSPVLLQDVLSVSRLLTDVAAGPPPDLRLFQPGEIQMHAYVPIFDPTNGNQIIGFGRVSWAADPTASNQFSTIAPQPGIIAPQNASGVLAEQMPNFPSTMPSLSQSLLAPVLAH